MPSRDDELDDDAYLRIVEARFLALRGQGYALSARDVGRVLEWRADGVPLRVVVGVIEDELRKRRATPAGAGTARPLTLGLVARSVASAARKVAERTVQSTRAGAGGAEGGGTASGTAPGDHYERLLATLTTAGQAVEARAKEALRAAWRGLVRLRGEGADAWRASAEVDDELARALLAVLDEGERAALVARVEAGLDARMSASAREAKRAFELGVALRERFEVPELLGVLLDGG